MELIAPQHLSREAAEALIALYLPLVRRLAAQIAGHAAQNVEPLELVNAGVFGLIAAVNRFDPTRGDKFASYARIRIRGAILDTVREHDNLSRGQRNFAKQYKLAKQKLSKDLDRIPNDEELAAELKMPIERLKKLVNALDASATQVPLSVADKHNLQLSGGAVRDVFDFGTRDPLTSLLHLENSKLLDGAIQSLSPREQLCIRLSFFENIALTSIAEIMEVTLSRVSQIRTEALQKLKKQLIKYS